MALASQMKAVAAQKSGFFDAEITPVTIAQKKGSDRRFERRAPRETSLKRSPSSRAWCAPTAR